MVKTTGDAIISEGKAGGIMKHGSPSYFQLIRSVEV